MPVERTPPRDGHASKKNNFPVGRNLNSAPNMDQSTAQQTVMSQSQRAGEGDNGEGEECLELAGDQAKEVSKASGDVKKSVGKLDDSVFQPFVPSSRHNSQRSDSSSDQDARCAGGPGKKTCNEHVEDGQLAVQCDKCLRWFHAACQKVTKPALTALKKFEDIGVCWLCNHCKANISRLGTGEEGYCRSKIESLNDKMCGMEDALRQHMRCMEQVLKEHERNISDQRVD